MLIGQIHHMKRTSCQNRLMSSLTDRQLEASMIDISDDQDGITFHIYITQSLCR